ncbi:MAG TPA: hypothetical protein VM571_06180, partial [Noviherbaspirillum sp.]|nr:hypothetical protein [Noviherbaspirillum sp.]
MRAFPFPKLPRAAGWLAVLVIGAAAATGATGATAAETPASAVHIALRPEADVNRTHITVGDIATVSADSQEMRNALLALRVASAPRIGYVDRYSRAEVELVVRRGLASKKVKTAWSGARFVKVRSVGRTLEAGAIVDAARAAALKQLGEKFEAVDLQLASPLDDMVLPMGELRFKPRTIDTSHVASRLPVWVDIDVDGVPYRSVVVPFSVNASQLVLVARRDLAQGGAV